MSFDIRDHKFPLPDGWSYKRIGDVALVNADTIKKKGAPDEIYYIDISSVSNGTFEPPKHMPYSEAPSRAKRRVKNNDFIISTVRPNLKQYVFLDEVHENWVASTGFAVVSAMEPGTEWYLYSVITSNLFNEHLVRVADGGAYPAFNPKEIEDAVIHWPDSQTLELIDNVAKHLNTKQKANSQTNQTLEQIAQALFKSWFVDFDPVKEKIAVLEAGGTAEEAELAAMSMIAAKSSEQLAELKQSKPDAYEQLAQTAALFPSAMQESELGEIPEGWTVEALGKYIEIKRGGSPRPIKDFIVPEGYPWTKIADATANNNPFIFKTNEYIKEDGLRKTVFLKQGTLILSNSATPGLPRFLDLDACIHDGWLYFPNKEKFTDTYLYFLFLVIRRELIMQGNGSVFTNLKTDILRNQPVVVPPNEVIAAFDRVAACSLELIKNKSRENNNLSETRDSMLPQILSGELQGI